ncbi:hypothetical protein ACHHYP_16371 [Achlya hypogyna]|uniref:Uncharacterized protein n=1 Tax=Achlya hypogyna TaxID=1202772 RepID=A0A1V9Y8T1_ACHHY|nr:hypothetical protein ACHHYP_16371 [Achlya hypogyna]
MLVHQEASEATCAEASLDMGGAENVQLELAAEASRTVPLRFGDAVYVVSMRKKRYLTGYVFGPRLHWAMKCSDKAIFRVTGQTPGHRVQVHDRFSLRSVRWPSFSVGFSPVLWALQQCLLCNGRVL